MLKRKFSKPQNGEDFEILVCDILRRRYKSNSLNLRRYGRSGQIQNGVEIVGYFEGAFIAAQCKLNFPKAKISDDLINAVEHYKPLSIYYIATTESRDI